MSSVDMKIKIQFPMWNSICFSKYCAYYPPPCEWCIKLFDVVVVMRDVVTDLFKLSHKLTPELYLHIESQAQPYGI